MEKTKQKVAKTPKNEREKVLEKCLKEIKEPKNRAVFERLKNK